MTRLERMIVEVDRPAQTELRNLPASFRIAAMVLMRARYGCLDITFPDGRTFRFRGTEPGPEAEILVNDKTFAKAALTKGDIGFAEAYMDGRIDTGDMALVLEFFTRNFDHMREVTAGGALTKFINNIRHAMRANSRKGSKRNILAHYDLGNEFYSAWLDPTMTYSSGIFDGDGDDLQTSQINKYALLANRLKLQPGQRVLEIGGGSCAPMVVIGPRLGRRDGFAIRTAAAGWRGGIVPAHADLAPEAGPANPLAGMLAAALAINEAFLHVNGAKAAGRSAVGLSLWRPFRDVDWLEANPSEATLTYLPSQLWLIGLGHLGQANLWALGLLAFAAPADVMLVLQDVDPS